MTMWVVGGFVVLGAVLYLLGWERGRRGATLQKSAQRWLAEWRKPEPYTAKTKQPESVPSAGPLDERQWRELLNFLQYDGSEQPPLDSGET